MAIIDDAVFVKLLSKITEGTTQTPVNWKYTAFFTDSNNNKIEVHNVLAVTKISKYSTAISDFTFVTVNIFKGIYFQLLGTNRRMLSLTLTQTPNSVTGTTSAIGMSIVRTYDAYLTDNTSEAVETRSGQLTGTHLDDLGELINVDVHLVERGLAEFRLWNIGGVYRNVTMLELMQGLMSQPLKAFGDGLNVGYNVTVYPTSNTERYYQRLIPNGVPLIDLPGWLQKKWGVYSAGLGYYLTQKMWYVYPLYDYTRYNASTKRMTIVNVPVNEMVGLTNTYFTEGAELYVFATGKTKHIDTSDRQLDISGTGFRSAIMGNLIDHFTESKQGVTSIPTGRNLIAVTYEQREGNLDNIRPVPGLLSCNPWADSSKAISNMGNIVNVTWEYSNPDLLVPGMPLKFIYKALGVAYSLFGILQAVNTHTATPQKSVLDNRYVTTSNLTLFVERPSN